MKKAILNKKKLLHHNRVNSMYMLYMIYKADYYHVGKHDYG